MNDIVKVPTLHSTADESVRELSDVDTAGEQQAEETHRSLPGEWKLRQKRNHFQHANGTRRQS